MKWIASNDGGCIITLKVTPRAGRSEFAGVTEEWLRVRLAAPPVDGKANEALIKLLARKLGIPRGAVEIISGDTARLKRVKLLGVAQEQVCAALQSGD